MGYRSALRPGSFERRTVVVTGGGSGIGRCTAHELASLGALAVLVGRRRERLDQVRGEIEADGGRAASFPCDVRDEAQVERAVAQVVERCGPIHGLVNNAGGQFVAPLAEISQKGFEAVVRLDLVGAFLMSREVYRQSMHEHGGAIVNVIATHWDGMPTVGHAGAARAGLDNLTRTAALEWGASGVRVNAVAPGTVLSSGLDTYEGEVGLKLEAMRQTIPLKRIATEAEISAPICFLLSEGAAYISGATLRVDAGGLTGNVGKFELPPARNSFSFEGFHRARPPKAARPVD